MLEHLYHGLQPGQYADEDRRMALVGGVAVERLFNGAILIIVLVLVLIRPWQQPRGDNVVVGRAAGDYLRDRL